MRVAAEPSKPKTAVVTIPEHSSDDKEDPSKAAKTLEAPEEQGGKSAAPPEDQAEPDAAADAATSATSSAAAAAPAPSQPADAYGFMDLIGAVKPAEPAQSAGKDDDLFAKLVSAQCDRCERTPHSVCLLFAASAVTTETVGSARTQSFAGVPAQPGLAASRGRSQHGRYG